MAIQLTEEQERQLKAGGAGKPTEVFDTSRRRYILLPADEYEALRDDQDQAALRQSSLRNLASRLAEEA